jgi:alpha-galactosidase
MTVKWDELGLRGTIKIRDLWRHKDLGKFRNSFEGDNIPSHGCMVVMLRK